MTATALQIDTWLRTQNRWVSTEELCQRFNVEERDLRAHGKRPGLLTTIAIAGPNGGFKHLRLTTLEERVAAKHKKKKVLLAAVRNLRWQEEGTHNQLTRIPVPEEIFTHQEVMPGLLQ